MNNYYGSGFNPYMQPIQPYQPQRFQTPDQQYVNQINMQAQQPPVQPIYKPTVGGLQGKVVDSIDVVKATDITLDGSISYFPIADGSCIATKQIAMDGTSKIVVYKPVEEAQTEEILPKYVTSEELDEKLKNIDSGKDFKEDIKNLKKQMKDLSYDFEKLNEELEERKN